MDLRGHGLSDAPTEGYDPPTFAGRRDRRGRGLRAARRTPADRVVLAGHGFGAIVAAWAAAALGERCAGLVLVDGGWESLEAASGMDVDEFLRGLDEPPEVMRSMTAFLADRAAFDPATWDADQERAARATRRRDARRQGRARRPGRTRSRPASGRCSGTTRSATLRGGRRRPSSRLAAADDEAGSRARGAGGGLGRARGRRPDAASGRASFGHDGHNLMRYRPDAVSAAILSVAGDDRR